MQVKTFDLTSLVGSNGFVIPGVVAGGRLGYSVSTAGDVNGDGIDDLVLGAPGGNGASYVLFGTRNTFPASFDLGNLNGSDGFVVIPGVVAGGGLGSSVSAAGDINGDGIADLFLGANGENSYNGTSYVLFVSRSGFSPSFDLSNLNGINGFTVPGIAVSGNLGSSVSTAGDVNGDGLADLVLGAFEVNSDTGASYVVFGTQGGFPPSFNLNNLNGNNGFVIPGIVPSGWLGYSVSTAGDVNGDGISDLVLGAIGVNSFNGASYVIFGSREGFPSSFNLANLNGSNGFSIPGIAPNGELGVSVKTAGDINGDGISDLVLGAPRANPSGVSYVIFGGLASILLIKNELTITEGEVVTLTNDNLSAVGLISFDSLAFTVNQVNGGRFAFVNNPATAIFNFTQVQINNGQVAFIADRSAPVSYQVGMVNVTDGSPALPSIAANVIFTDPLPQVISVPLTQEVIVNEPFNFALQASQIFNDSDGDPLTYSAQLSDGSVLPNWLHFDTNLPNQLVFSGTAPSVGGTQISLFAKDPINASVSTEFEILAALPNNGSAVNIFNTSTIQIAGSVVAGLLGLAALLGGGLGFWRYATDRTSRKDEQFADYIRDTLSLQGVSNFKNNETGKKYVVFVQGLIQALQQAGTDPTTMRPGELHELANDVALAARNKITPATDCLGRSVVSVTDLSDNLQNLVTEVQVLRLGNNEPADVPYNAW